MLGLGKHFPLNLVTPKNTPFSDPEVTLTTRLPPHRGVKRREMVIFECQRPVGLNFFDQLKLQAVSAAARAFECHRPVFTIFLSKIYISIRNMYRRRISFSCDDHTPGADPSPQMFPPFQNTHNYPSSPTDGIPSRGSLSPRPRIPLGVQ